MKLVDIIKNIEIEEKFQYDENLEINQICFNSKEVTSQSLFVAIKGYKIDGHRFIPNAIENGANVIVVNEIDPSLNICQLKVKDSRVALSMLAANFYDQPSKKVKVVGITATNGKTSTSTILDSIFNVAKLKTALLGTVVNKIGNDFEKAILTTPESKDLQQLFAKMVENQIDVCTMEVSSLALELKRVHDVAFDVVAMNNISREHIDEHGSFELYFNNKQKLITEAKKETVAVLNIDDTYVSSLIPKTNAKVITFSLKDENADIYCFDIDINLVNPSFKIRIRENITLPSQIIIKKSIFDVELQSGGYHSVMNAVSAISCALCLGIDIETIQKGISNFSGVERRFQLIYHNEYRVYDDHFANEGNVNATMQSIAMMQFNQFVMILAIRGDRGVSVNLDVIDTLIRWYKQVNVDHLFVTSYQDFDIKNNNVSDEEKNAVLQRLNEANIHYTFIENLNEAIEKALAVAKKEDLVLLAGCQGMDNGAKVLCQLLESQKSDALASLKSLVEKRIAGE